MSSRFSTLTALAVFVALACAASPAAAAPGDFAAGSGSVDGATFSFEAVGGPGPFPELPDSASGTMTYSSPEVTVTATVTCLVVEENRAVIRGITESGNIRFTVEDNGTPGAGVDRFAGPSDIQNFGCPGIAPAGSGSPITAGDIVVSAACDSLKEHKDPDKDKCKDKKDKKDKTP